MTTAAADGTDPAQWIETGARVHPHRVFLRTSAGHEISYGALKEKSARFAEALARRGVTAGDRVAVRVEKSAEAVLLYLACLQAGAVFVPVNAAGTAHEFEHVLRDSGPRVAIVAPGERGSLGSVAGLAGVGQLETLGTEGDGTLPELARLSEPAWSARQSLPADSVAAIVYTSGTTGRPKGAMLTRANLASNASVLARSWHFTAEDRLLHALPLFHVHGLFVAINTVLAAGAALLLLPKFDATAVLGQLPAVTVFMGVPTHYTRLLQEERLTAEVCRHMRLFVSGSAPLLADTHREFQRRTGHTILERYGMTETLMNTSNPYEGPRVPGSVGPPLPGVQVRVADRASGTSQAAGVIGDLEIKGPNVFAGYWRDPHKTRGEFTADGWFRTGDLGCIDALGYVSIVGRAKDLVISGGYNVYPKEVESELDTLPEVAESAVFGTPHPDFGEGVTAAVVLRPGQQTSEAQLIEALRARLSAYKLPKRILLVSELPRNTMGKVRKDALRTTYASLYIAD